MVDDGSTDGSPAIDQPPTASASCRCSSRTADRARRSTPASPPPSAAVVIFLDADDRLAPAAARTVAAAFAADPELASVQYRLRVIDGDGRSERRDPPRRSGSLPCGDLAAHVIRFRAYHWQPTTGNAYAASALTRILPLPEASYRIEADAYLAELIAVLRADARPRRPARRLPRARRQQLPGLEGRRRVLPDGRSANPRGPRAGRRAGRRRSGGTTCRRRRTRRSTLRSWVPARIAAPRSRPTTPSGRTGG